MRQPHHWTITPGRHSRGAYVLSLSKIAIDLFYMYYLFPASPQFLISRQGPTRSVVNISKKRLVSFVYIYTTCCSGPL